MDAHLANKWQLSTRARRLSPLYGTDYGCGGTMRQQQNILSAHVGFCFFRRHTRSRIVSISLAL